ncbi:MAG: hypothetical protein ACR2O1_05230 [Boseongicola sp.]
MSKSVSGQDVEDMLSSVRRLVSSELPKNLRSRLPEGPGALVLTDAQRIEPSMIGHNSQPKSLEDRISELEAAVSESADDWEPDGSEDQDQHRPDRIVYKPPEEDRQSNRRRSLRLSEIALIETGPANDDESEDSDPAAVTPTFRHGSDDDETRSFEEEESSADVEASADVELSDIPEFLPTSFQSDAPETNEAAEDDIQSGDSEDEGSDSSVDFSEEEIESDTGSVEGIATEESFEEALAEAVAASLPDTAVEEVERQQVELSSERSEEIHAEQDVAEIDKESLHTLVASLIREELQGELGERITRNVRKLVRQEIQRALTVRELE